MNFVAVAEATQLALDAGVDAGKIPQALKGGRADSAILQEFMGKMAARDYTPSGRIDNMVKDLNGITAVEFSTLRRLQNIEFRGRTNIPSFEQERDIFNACKNIYSNSSN